METSHSKTPFSWADFFSFKSMIALRIMQVLYVFIAFVITFGSLIAMFASIGPFSGFFPGLLLLVGGNIFWRLWCELIIVMFRINKTLYNIDNNTQKKTTI